MNQKMIRILLLVCTLCLCVCTVSACSGTNAPPQQTTPSGETHGDTETDEGEPSGDDERTSLHPQQQDFDNYTYRMVFDGGLSPYYYGPQEEVSGEALDVAFYNRNQFIENYFNINIEMSTLSSEYQMAEHLSVASSAGTDFADAFFSVAGHVMPSAVANGYALDLTKLDELNLGASYWDQRIQREYSIQGRLFALEGDFTVWDDLRTHVVLYNGDLYRQFGYTEIYGSPYEMVRAGNWTLDTMLEMFEGRSDIDNGPLTSTSKWGMLSETPFPYIVFLGTGMKTIEVQEDGSLSLLFADNTYYDRVYNVFEDILRKVGLNQEVLLADASNGVLSGDIWTGVSNMFEANLALFRTTTLSAATRLTNMEADFGILPIPKYDQTQETYYSWCTSDAHTPLMIPATALSHIDTTAAITEAICYFSKYMDTNVQTVLEAFYENMAVAKLCRTGEDYAMLQLIFANKTYDIDGALGITGIRMKTGSLAGKRDISTLASEFAAIKDSSLNKLSELLANMIKNVKN